ncbi:MAG: alpha/beta hydrolase family protein [Acidimicrobiales bacterium]
MTPTRYGRRARRRRRLSAAVLVIVVAATITLTLTGGTPHRHASKPLDPRATTTTAPPPPAPPYAIGTLSTTLTEPPGTGGSSRILPTVVRYPASGAAGSPATPGAAPLRTAGPYPLVVFSEGFDVSPESYALLLDAWAAAGYVVADPTYPFTSPTSPGGPVRADIVNHPADLSFVISTLLQASAAPSGSLSGLIAPGEVGVIGHSDGGDVSLASVANTCCRDARIKAAVILSGAELSWFKGQYFTAPSVPMLVVQGTNDPYYNPPSCSVQIYNQASQPKYYLSMIGQDHTSAYIPPGPAIEVVAKVTIAFLDEYLKGSPSGSPGSLLADGTVQGLATITDAPSVPIVPGACPDAPAG